MAQRDLALTREWIDGAPDAFFRVSKDGRIVDVNDAACAMYGYTREEFRAMLRICEALRDNTKSLLQANVTSWETGQAQADVYEK